LILSCSKFAVLANVPVEAVTVVVLGSLVP